MIRVLSGLLLLIVLSGFSFVVASESSVDFYVGVPEEGASVEGSSWSFFDYFVLGVFILIFVYFVFRKNKKSVKKKKRTPSKGKSRVRIKKKG